MKTFWDLKTFSRTNHTKPIVESPLESLIPRSLGVEKVALGRITNIYHTNIYIYIIYLSFYDIPLDANPLSVYSKELRFSSGSFTKTVRILVVTGILGEVSQAIPLESHETLFGNQKTDTRFRT